MVPMSEWQKLKEESPEKVQTTDEVHALQLFAQGDDGSLDATPSRQGASGEHGKARLVAAG